MKELKELSLLQKTPNHNEELTKLIGLLQINNSIIKSSKHFSVCHKDKIVENKNNVINQQVLIKNSHYRNANLKNKLLSKLEYTMEIDATDEDMIIPSENVKISNVLLSNIDRSQTLNSTIKSIPITTPKNGKFNFSSKSISIQNSVESSKSKPTLKCKVSPTKVLQINNSNSDLYKKLYDF